MASRILVVDDSPTIRRIVSRILERKGYETVLASDGGDAMAALTSGKVDVELVLVDFVMPRMNGFQFCRALRAQAEHATLPVVLMSARGDRIRDQFVQQTGAIDAITKPFEPEALIAVIENALFRANAASRESSRRLLEVEETLDEETANDRTQRMHRERDAKGGIVLSGEITGIPVGAILQLLCVENQSGALVCKSEDAEVTTWLRNGLIDIVLSSGTRDEFRLGRFFVEEGIVSATQIEDMVEITKTEGATSERHMLLGGLLRSADLITDVQLRHALTRQSSELLYEVMRWDFGSYEFHRDAVPHVAGEARLGVPVASVILEGFRRVDEWRALERTLGSFDGVLLRDEAALARIASNELPAKEKEVLEAVDGDRSVRQILTYCAMSSFDTCRILVQFLEARVLRKRAG